MEMYDTAAVYLDEIISDWEKHIRKKLWKIMMTMTTNDDNDDKYQKKQLKHVMKKTYGGWGVGDGVGQR